MLVLAHRGLHDAAPENTLAAFRCAIAAGCDGIETDLRVSADGEVVLYHDRLTPDGCPVESLSRAALSARVGYPVPTLAEALAEDADILWNLEFKVRKALPPALPILRAFRKRRMLCSSFIHSLVFELVAALDIEGALLVAHDPVTPFARGAGAFGRDARVRSLVCDFGSVQNRTLQVAAESGLAAYVYNIVTQAEHEAVARQGIAGVITDYPAAFLAERGRGGAKRGGGAR